MTVALITLLAISLGLLLYFKVGSDLRTWRLQKEKARLESEMHAVILRADETNESYQQSLKEYSDLKRRHSDVVTALGLRKP